MNTPYIFSAPAINLQSRSPYYPPNSGANMPHAPIPLDIWYDAAGNPTVNGQRIQAAQNSGNATPHGAVVPTFDNAKYGDSVVITLSPTGVGVIQLNNSPIILQRPNNTRTLLLIVNQTLAQIFYDFDKNASQASVPIAAGGNRLWDGVVPQGNLSLWANAAGVNGVIIEYMNLDVMK